MSAESNVPAGTLNWFVVLQRGRARVSAESGEAAFIEELRANGGDCVDDVIQDQGLTVCTFF